MLTRCFAPTGMVKLSVTSTMSWSSELPCEFDSAPAINVPVIPVFTVIDGKSALGGRTSRMVV